MAKKKITKKKTIKIPKNFRLIIAMKEYSRTGAVYEEKGKGRYIGEYGYLNEKKKIRKIYKTLDGAFNFVTKWVDE